ncbi:MAG: uracil-DNA glycosylase, partial [Bacteroidia bacterium]
YKYEIDNGDLSRWSNQGVLLWNVYLTVRKNEPLSHRFKEYENLTKSLLNFISKNKRNVVFMLWGKFAQSKQKLINKHNHYILLTSHPSPLAAHRGFLGSNHFKKCNQFLNRNNLSQIDWSL